MKPDTAHPAIATPTAARPGSPNHALDRRDDHFYEELSRINNELANLQRELARTNADLVAANKRLEASEQRYRCLSAGLPIGVFEMDASGRCVSTNAYWQAISGLTAEECLEDGWQRALDPRDAPAFLRERDLAHQSGREFKCEVRFRTTHGDPRWAQVRSRTIPGEGGKAAVRVSTAEDITDRKQAESQLRKLSRAVEQSPVSIMITDLQGAIEYVNPKFCALTGYSFDEVRGKNPRILKSGEMPAECYSQMWAKITAGEEWSGEFHNRKKNGELYWESASISSIRNDQGQITHFVAVKEDISQRRRESALLLDSQQRLELATRSAHFGVWDWNLVANHKVWDAQMHVLYGIREQDFDGSQAGWQKRVHPDDRDRVAADMQNALAGSKDYNTEFRVVWPNGEVHYLEAHALVQRAENGSPVRMIGVNRDITKRKRAQQVQKEQLALRERLAKLAANVPGLLYSFRLRPDKGICLPYASPTIEEFFGVRAEDMLTDASSLLNQIHPEDRSGVDASIAESARTVLPLRAEFRVRHPQKGLFWVEAQSTPEREADGSILWHGFMSDISQRKRAEAALQESNRRFQEILENVELVALTLDRHCKITFCNEFFLRLTGWKLAEVIGRDWCEYLLPESAAAMKKLFCDSIANSKIPSHLQNPIKTRTGALRMIAWNNTMLRDAAGGIIGTASIGEDVTDRNQAELALRESEAKFHQLADNISDVFWLTSPDSNTIHFVSVGYQLTWGRSTESLYANPHQWVEAILPEEREHVFAVFATLMKDAPEVSVEYRISRPDGTIRWIHDRGFQVRDAAGNLIRLSGIASDITERKRTAQELAERKQNEEHTRLALEHEQKSSQIKDRFVSMVSHEFRTPLSIINMAAELLDGYLDKMSDAERSEHLRNIQTSVERMTQMMNDFLVHGNCAGKKIECHPARMEVGALCRKLIAEVPGHAGAQPLIECAVESTVGEAWLDERILRHILGNLLSNAAKYSLGGQPVKLEVRRMAASPQPNGEADMLSKPHLEFKVSDSGIGIPAADFAKLYQTFHRAANVGNRPGTGMGLAIVKQFVDLLGGRIRIASAEGKGTTVWVQLPVAPPIAQTGS
jgi:PAS domain S-box-containing protein